MKHHSFSFFVVLLALGFVFGLVWTTPAIADNLYASIRGTVTDPAGAVVPDAKLTATNVVTGIRYSSASNKDGLFTFVELPIGDYEVKVEKGGFKTFAEGNIHLDLNQIFNLQVKMELGVVSDTITVEANPAQVETTSMQLGNTVSASQIVDIPLNGRNWTQLQQLEPGVQASSDRMGTYSTNGAETQQNSFLINGTDTNDTALNVPLVIPSPDAIGEFTMVTSTINPEYGRNSGAIINASIKSGTNQFHGDVFEFYRDTFLDAKSWFEPSASPFHQNQFGGTVGGPIIKDHAFFFFSYQGTRNTVPQPYAGGQAPTVYSSAERGGDFSADATLPASTNPIPFAMYGDAASSCPVSGGVQCQPGGALTYADLFSTGVIPAQDLNPLALKLMNQYVPLPNGANNEYLFNPSTVGKQDQYLGRLDETLSKRDAIWFYGLYENDAFTSTLPFTGASLPGFAASDPAKYYEFTAAWNHTFSPTTLNEARIAYLRFNFIAVDPVTMNNPTTYGFNITPQAPQYAQLPVMGITGLFTLGFSANGPQPRVQNTYQVTDNFSKVWGHHTFKAGFNMDRLEINNPFYNNLNGNFGYQGAGVFSTGNAGADFLLGVPDSYTQGSGSIVRARGREYFSYGQDQWQVRPDLTLTLGVAWDIETPYKNLYANGEVMSAFRPGQQSTVFPTAPLGYVFPGDKGINSYGGPTIHYSDFAPRLGFAWSPRGNHNWSIRGGIGLYYNRSEEELTLQTLGNPPFSLSAQGAGALGTGPGFINPYASANTVAVGGFPTGSLANPFPFTPPTSGASVPASAWLAFEPLGFNVNTEDPRMTAPRSTNYNLNIQYQVTKSTVATIGYVGNVTRHLEGAYNLNPAGIAPGTNQAAVNMGCTSDFFLADCTGGATFPLGAATNVIGQPGVQVTDFSSNYNSLQATITRHFSNGLSFQAAYTWSRYFDYTSSLENSSFDGPGLNNYSIAGNYGPSANDAPQRLVVNYVYTLPFYKLGHHWKRLTDDWRLSGITTFQHGFPVQVFSLGYNDLQWSYPDAYYAPPDKAELTGTPIGVNHNPRNNTIGGLQNYWINPAAFTIPNNGTIGNSNRNPFYGPGLNYWDMALSKDVHFTETKFLEMRLETFDTFNHANFASPDAFVGDPNFGRILGAAQISTNGDGRVVQLAGKIYF